MKEYRLIFSSTEPVARDCIWAKPVVGGFTLYMLQRGILVPLRIVDDKKTPYIHDDTIFDVADVQHGEIVIEGINWDE